MNTASLRVGIVCLALAGCVGSVHAAAPLDALRDAVSEEWSMPAAWDATRAREVMEWIEARRGFGGGSDMRPAVSVAVAVAERDAIVRDALTDVVRSREARGLIESWLEEGPGALGDETLDRMALLYESALPAIEARALIDGAYALRAGGDRGGEALCRSAIGVLGESDLSGVVAGVLSGHALRFVGEYEDAIRAYTEAIRSLDTSDGSVETRMLYAEALCGAAIASARLAPASDDAERLLSRLEDSGALRGESQRVMLLDARFEVDRLQGIVALEAGVEHARVYRRAIEESAHEVRQAVLRSLAGIGAMGGADRSSDRAPGAMLFAMFEHDRGRRDAPDLLRAAYEKARLVRDEFPSYWEEVATTYGHLVVYDDLMTSMQDAFPESDFGAYVYGGRGMAPDGALALLEVLERHAGTGARVWPHWKAVSGLDAALQVDALDADGIDRFYRALRTRLDSSRGLRRDTTQADRDAMLTLLEVDGDRFGAVRRLEELMGLVEAADPMYMRVDAMRLGTSIMRESSVADAVRERAAAYVLEIAPAIGVRADTEFDRSLEPACHLMAAGAEATLGNGAGVLERLEVSSADGQAPEEWEPYWRSAHELRAHAHVLLGDIEAAADALGRLLTLGEGERLLPGRVFTAEQGLGESLMERFHDDETAADERLVIEARYALVRAELADGRSYSSRESDAALLVGAGEYRGALDVLGSGGALSPAGAIVRGEAMLGLGDDAAAFGVFRGVASAAEGDAALRSERPYWHAWARMLEILERQNTDGVRTDEIARTVRRLRTLASWGTQADCVEKIEAVAGRVAG